MRIDQNDDTTLYRWLMALTIGIFSFVGIAVYDAVQESKKMPPSEDLNRDGKVTIEDFSVGVYLLDNIMNELNKQGVDVTK